MNHRGFWAYVQCAHSLNHGILILSALLGIVLFVLPIPSPAQRQNVSTPTVEYLNRERCGIVDVYRMPPQTHLQADFNGDGTVEHYFATWGGIELHRVQSGTQPPTFIRESVLYTSQSNHQYSCVDLRAYDYDSDRKLELIYGSHKELVIFEYINGSFRQVRKEEKNLSSQANVKLRCQGSIIEVIAQ